MQYLFLSNTDTYINQIPATSSISPLYVMCVSFLQTVTLIYEIASLTWDGIKF